MKCDCFLWSFLMIYTAEVFTVIQALGAVAIWGGGMMDFRCWMQPHSLFVAVFCFFFCANLFFPCAHLRLGSDEEGNASSAFLKNYIFSHLKCSAEYQVSHHLPAAWAKKGTELSVCEFDHRKRAGNCHILSPSALQSSLKGRGQERKWISRCFMCTFPKVEMTVR